METGKSSQFLLFYIITEEAGMRIKRGFCALLLAFCVFVLTAGTGMSQNFPERPIRIIITFPAGGTSDILTRILGNKLSERFGQPIVVDNRPGAAGIIACELAAKATPDGYTLIMGYVGTHAINASLFRKLSYDPVKDFTPISLVGVVPNIVVVHPSLPANNIKELIDLAKTRSGKIFYGSAGNGSAPHLAGVLFNTMANLDIIHVPFKGAPQMTQDLLAGNVQMTFPGMPTVVPLVKSGRLKALAVTSLKRSPAFPDLPTISETLPGYEVISWYGVMGPADVPRDVVRKLNAEIVRALSLPDLKQDYAKLGAESSGGTPEAFAELIKAEIIKWAKVVKASGARAD
jgi:tripartite-type tricarboxylate transporter receptor subunit TctC